MTGKFFAETAWGWLLWAALIAVPLGCGGVIGWKVGRAPLLVDLAQQTETHAREKQLAAEQATAALQAAQRRGDALTTRLSNQRSHIDKLKTEARRAIPEATTGRACLDMPALRVLDSAPGLAVAGLPPATGGAAGKGGRVATDTDIAGWAVDAGGDYATCRARLAALIDWHTPASKPARATESR